MTEKSTWRYLTFAGDKPHTPLRKAFFQAADFKASIASSLVAASVITLADPKDSFQFTLSVAILVSAVNIYMLRSREKPSTASASGLIKFPESAFNDKVIDTQPDTTTPPTSAQDLKNAANTAESYKTAMKRDGLANLVILSCMMFMVQPYVPPAVAILIIPSFIRQYLGMLRFNKVANGEWVIADLPPPEKVTETKKENAPISLRPQADMAP